MANETIDAIKVGLGVDLSHLESDATKAKQIVDRNLPKDRIISVYVRVKPNRADITNLHAEIQKGLSQTQQGQQHKQLLLRPRIVIDQSQEQLRNVRRDIEQAFKKGGTNQNAVHVPIRFNGDTKGLVASIEAALKGVSFEVAIKGRYDGPVPGHEPPKGSGPPSGPAPGGAPRRPTPTPPPPGGAPSGATARPARATTTQVHPAPATVTRPPRYGTRVETSTADRADYGAPPPRAPKPKTVPPGGRVSFETLRGGRNDSDLTPEEQKQYASQMRARPTPALGQFPQPGEPSRRVSPSAVRRQEEMAAQRRRAEAAARAADPRTGIAQGHIASGLHTLDPDLGHALDILQDPEATLSSASLVTAAELRREAYATATHGQPKRVRKARQRVRGVTKNFDPNVDPSQLLYDAALDAARAEQEALVDPLARVRGGDTKLRGKGGKVGRIGSRSAGVLASESIDPSTAKRQPRIKTPAITPIVAGEAYGGFMEDAPTIPGGQGLIRGTGIKPRGENPVDIDLQRVGRGDLTLAEYHRRHPEVAGRGVERIGAYPEPPMPIGAKSTAAGWMERVSRQRGRLEPRFTRRPDLFFAEGGSNSYMTGLYGGRDIGQTFGADEGHVNAATANTYAWKRLRLTQIQHQPYCAHCGISRFESKQRFGKDLTADKVRSQAQGGDPNDPSNLQTLCPSCNSRKSGSSAQPDRLWDHPRPNLLRSKRVTDKDLGEFLPHGKYFGISSLAEVVKRKAEGGQIKHGGLLGRMAQSSHEPEVTMVGERGRELLVTDKGTGQTEVVPTHKVSSWLQGSQTGRAEGGRFSMRMPGGNAWKSVPLSRLTSGVVGGSDILRVFVTNWPTGLTQTGVGRTGAQNAPAGAQANQSTPPPAAPPGAANPPRQPGAQASPAAPSPNAPRPPRGVDPLLRVRSREAAFRSTEALEGRIGITRAGISERLQEAPVRALSVAFGQIAQNVIGGRAGILARAREASGFAASAQRSVGELRNLEQGRRELAIQTRTLRQGGLKTPAEQAQFAANTAELTQRGQAIREQRALTEARVGRAETAEGGILTRGQQFKAQAVGLGGIIAGTQLFTAAIGAVSVAGQAGAAALRPLVDQLTGWTSSIEATTGAIRDNITQLHGQSRVATAAALAGSGISARFLDQQGGGITRRAEANAASVASQQQLDITRAAAGLGQTKFDKGLFGGTGGLLGSNIATEVFGGQPGVLENVNKRIDAALGADVQTAGRGGKFGPTLLPRSPQEVIRTATEAGHALKDTVADLNHSFESAAKAAGQVASDFEVASNASKDQTDAMLASAKAVSEAMGSPEALLQAGQLASRGVAITGRGGAGLTGQQFGTASEQLARGLVMSDPALLLRSTQNQRNAQLFQTRQTGINQRTQDIPAQQFLENLANPLARFGTTFSTRGQGLEQNAAGQQTLANVEKYSKISADAQTKILALTSQGQAAAEAIVAQIDRPGTTGVPGPATTGGHPGQGPGPALTQFRQVTSQIGETGNQIRAITDALDMRQTNFQVTEYNNQIRIAQRSLGDARDTWAAIRGTVRNTVGGLQGQNLLLDRQNHLLSMRQQKLSFKSEDIGFKQADLQFKAQQMQFELSQRSINFSKAVAGFQSPGMTSEERAANIAQAKIEADFAQKQLNIQEQIARGAREQLSLAKQQSVINREMIANQNKQANNSFAISVKEAQRNVTDLQAQVNQLFAGRALTIDAAAAQKTIADLEKQLAPLQASAQSLIQEGSQVRADVLADVTNMMAQTGKGFQELVGMVGTAWSEAARSYITNFLTPVFAGAGSPPAPSGHGGGGMGKQPPVSHGGGGGMGKQYGAAGISSRVDKATSFVAGEAGSEHVVVIRNPQYGVASFGGGGSGGGGGLIWNGNLNITVTGGAGGSNADEDAMANRLAHKVESVLMRRAAGMGLRPAGM